MSNFLDNLDYLKIIDNKTLPLSGSYTSAPISTNDRKLKGAITLQLGVTGTGTVKVEFEQSNNFNPADGTGDWIKPVSGYTIVTGFTAASGTGTNGKDLLNVPMLNSQYFRILATETGGANSVVVNSWLSMQ